MKKRIISWVMICIMIVTLMPQNALAADVGVDAEASAVEIEMEGVLAQGDLLDQRRTLSRVASDGGKGNPGILSDMQVDTIVQRLSDLDKFSKSSKSVLIDVGGYGITKENCNKVVSYIFNTAPELFYYQSSYELISDGALSNKVKYLKFYFNDTITALRQKKLAVEKEVNKFNRLVDENMTDMQVALLAHDYLATNIAYQNMDDSAYDVYGALVEKKAVCQGYALSMEMLLAENNIQCGVVSSRNIDHAWNVVDIDGKWYHMDVTWDDPSEDNLGRVNHQYMLLSDEGLFATPNGNARRDYVAMDRQREFSKCQDNRYRNYFWKNVDSYIHYYEGNWYYMDDRFFGLYEKNCSTGKTKTIVDDKQIDEPILWYATDDSMFWEGNFSRVVAVDNNLYFTTPTSIYSLDLDQKTPKCNRIYKTSSTKNLLYGLGLDKNVLTYVLKSSPWVKDGTIRNSGLAAVNKSKITNVDTNYNKIDVTYEPVRFVDDQGKIRSMSYLVMYRKSGNRKFTEISTTKNTCSIGQLIGNSTYYVKVRPYYIANGKRIMGQESSQVKVITNPVNKNIPCGKINKIKQKDGKVQVYTTLPYVAGGKITCQIAYRKANDSNYKTKMFKGTSIALSDLAKNTNYKVKLRYLYKENNSNRKAYSKYSNLQTFTTKK